MLTSSSPATPHTLVESKALPFMALVERLEVKWTEDKAFTHTSTMIQSQTKATSKLLEQYAQLKSEMQQVADELKQSQPSVSKADLNIRLTLLTQKISPLKEALGRQAIACFKQGAACAAQDQFAEAFASYCLTLRLLKVIPDNLTMLIMSVVSNIGTLFYHTGRYKDAIECYQATLLEGERIYGKGSRELASSCHHLANALLKIDQWQEALVYYQLAFNYLESKSKPTISAISSTTVPSISQQRIVPTSPLSIVEVLNGMGNVFLAQRKWEEALSYFKKAYDPVKNKESMEGAMIFNNMALILARQGKREQAFNDLSQVYKIYLKNVGKKHSLVALVLMNLGRVRCSQNRYREAFTYFNESLVIRKEIFGDESIHVAEILHEMGMAFLHQSQYAKAKECHQRALTIYRKATGETSLFVASAWDYLAHVHFECEEYENALSFYQKSLTIYKQSIHIASIPYAIVLQNMANVYVKQHHYPLAAKLLDEAEAIINQAPGGQSEEAAELFFNRGNLAVEGNPAQALKYYHQALAIKTRLFGNKSSQVATLLLNI
jgi:tetratricopeptide (TPR) repeat protein